MTLARKSVTDTIENSYLEDVISNLNIKKQWHQGFCGATELEFRQDSNNLVFDREHLLNKEPIRMDMLIVKKKKDVPIHNEMGHLFKGHNIIEYKSPDDGLTIDDFCKTHAYASLYKSLAPNIDEIKLNDITVTLVRDRYPVKLVKSLKKHGYSISEYQPGIYYVKGAIMYDTQIVVTSKLQKEHTWFRALTNRAKEQDIKEFITAGNKLTAQGDKENLDAIYQISVAANVKLFEELRRNSIMCESLKILMRPELEASRLQGLKQGISQGISQVIDTIRAVKGNEITLEEAANKLGVSINDIKGLI